MTALQNPAESIRLTLDIVATANPNTIIDAPRALRLVNGPTEVSAPYALQAENGVNSHRWLDPTLDIALRTRACADAMVVTAETKTPMGQYRRQQAVLFAASLLASHPHPEPLLEGLRKY